MSVGINKFLSPAELSRLNRLTLQSRYVVEGSLAGRHRSPFRGASSEFADHRAYIAGDDPKRLDWKVLGRTDRYYIRRYEDETNLRVYLVVDRSASMDYGSGTVTKFEYAVRLAAALGYVVIRTRDSAGLYLFSEKLNTAIGARNSFAHLSNMLATLDRARPSKKTRTAMALHRIADDIQRRALIVLMSDLLDDPDEIALALAHFRRQHHDVIVFHVLDDAELELPFPRGAEFEDLETGEKIGADPRSMRDEYRKAFGDFIEKHRQACAQLRVDYRLVNTKRDLDLFVRAYLEERKRISR
ncbi:MAG: DUF58 domain-containing protein [Lentisphaerae bacterium]|nr:DUF58 domain-containing protein [Lentisphaerota bacterium]